MKDFKILRTQKITFVKIKFYMKNTLKNIGKLVRFII